MKTEAGSLILTYEDSDTITKAEALALTSISTVQREVVERLSSIAPLSVCLCAPAIANMRFNLMRRTIPQSNLFHTGSLLVIIGILSLCLSGTATRSGLTTIVSHSATTKTQTAYSRPTKARQHSLTTHTGTFFLGIESGSKRPLPEPAVLQSKYAQALADNAPVRTSEGSGSPFTLAICFIRPPGRAPPVN